MAGNKIQIVATAKDEVSGPLAKMKDQFNVLGKNKGFQAVAQGVGVGVGISALGLLSSGIGKVTEFLGDSVKAYQEEQDSVSRLGASLKANVANWDGNTRAIEDVLSARMKLGFSDEDQRNSLALLVAATGDVNKALAIESTAMDLARFKHIDLATASEALTKVEAGSYRILKSLGIELKAGATQQDALNAVQRVAMGQTLEYANTDLGKLEIAQIKVNEAQEKMGKGLSHLEAELLPKAADAITTLADNIDKLSTNTEKEVNQIGDVWEKVFGHSIGLYLDSADQKAIKSGQVWSQATSDMVTATEHMRGDISQNFQTIAADVTADVHIAAKAVQVLPNRMAGDLRGGWSAVHDAAVALGEAMSKPIKAAAREKVLMDVLTGKGSVGRLLTKGLVSANPFAVEAARKLYADTIAELDAFRDFRIVVSAVIGGGAGKGGGQGPHSAPTRAPSHGPHRGSSTSGGSTGGSSGGHTININTLFPPSAQHKAELSRLLHELLAPDRELGSYSPG